MTVLFTECVERWLPIIQEFEKRGYEIVYKKLKYKRACILLYHSCKKDNAPYVKFVSDDRKCNDKCYDIESMLYSHSREMNSEESKELFYESRDFYKDSTLMYCGHYTRDDDEIQMGLAFWDHQETIKKK